MLPMHVLAVDVAKKDLVVFDGLHVETIPNTPASIQKLLKSHPGHRVVAEPTSSYHLDLIYAAHEQGHLVHLVNPKEMRNYKDSRSFRAKTDPLDARYLYEFATRHEGELRVWEPAQPHVRALRDLLGKRQIAVKSLMQLRQSCSETFGFEHAEAALSRMIQGLDQSLADLAEKDENYRRMQTIPGVGPVSAIALTYIFAAHSFHSVDALVAFLGLDLRVCDSGKHRGRRRLSKRGDPLLRQILSCAGWSLLRTKLAKDKALLLKVQNRHHAERMVIGARKVLKTAFALNERKIDFDLEKWHWAT
jgi:transposase